MKQQAIVRALISSIKWHNGNGSYERMLGKTQDFSPISVLVGRRTSLAAGFAT